LENKSPRALHALKSAPSNAAIARRASAFLAGDPKVIQCPLGYATGLGNGDCVLALASQRKCSFVFLGTMKHERQAVMLPALQTLQGRNFIRKSTSFQAATKYFNRSTIVIYKNTVFAPCPKGNFNPECLRLYDAIEWGCIPLIKRYRDSAYNEDYFDKLLGRHPIPTFDDWSEAADFANALLSESAALDALQDRVFTWWHGFKASLRTIVASKLAELAA
jgi:hypothetical protein